MDKIDFADLDYATECPECGRLGRPRHYANGDSVWQHAGYADGVTVTITDHCYLKEAQDART